MSGKRQHFIPQFLQEGFASHKVGDAVFTWVYRKSKPPFNTNIINVGVEGFFYTQEQDTLADDLITKAEGPLSLLVEELRSLTPGHISDTRVPELIAHLGSRTRHLRQSLIQTSGYLVSRIVDFVADQNFFANYLEQKLQNDPSLLRELFSEELIQKGRPQRLLEPMMKIALPLIPVLMAQLKPMLPIMAAELRRNVIGKWPALVKSGHIKALKQTAAPEIKIQRYKELAYDIMLVEDGSLILGDSAVLFKIEGQRPYKVLLEKGDTLRGIFLPLSPHTLLVGSCGGNPPSVSELRQALARCSLEYFIAHQISDENDLLVEQIAKEACPLTKEEMEKIIVETMNGQ